MKRITDPSFSYTPSVETDLKKTFARIRKRLKEQEQEQAEARAEVARKVSRIGKSK